MYTNKTRISVDILMCTCFNARGEGRRAGGGQLCGLKKVFKAITFCLFVSVAGVIS
jgi:hypothetical protein